LPGASLKGLTGRLRVGAIAFLGMFLIVDGAQLGAFEMIEAYGKSVTWGVVGILPTAVVIYIVGVFCVGAAEPLVPPFAAFRSPDPQDTLLVSRSGGPAGRPTVILRTPARSRASEGSGSVVPHPSYWVAR
jgi:hypothetical protein